ncbi:MAG TPA: diacylglycerol kinase [Lachnospiraceae bacterium]|nr:diacylglycerol kinase [Lachnospiraceae bacterium]
MERLLFIYNPFAGKGMIRNSLSHIIEEFSNHGYEVVVHPTSGVKDAARCVEECGDSFDMIVCCGGDGTLDEVVTGMRVGRFTRPLGYIPAGSTNDYATSLGIPKQMRNAAQSVMNGSVFLCDIGRMNDSYFVYVAAFGAFVNVSYDTPQDMKNMLGHLAYIVRGAQSLPSLKSYHMHYESAENSGTGDFMLGMITNSNSVGGFGGITGPDVTLNDGMFEVTLIRMPPLLAVEAPGILTALMSGGENKNVVQFKTARLELWFDDPVNWTRDGEFGGEHKHLVIENIPEALPIIIPDQSRGHLLAQSDHTGV